MPKPGKLSRDVQASFAGARELGFQAGHKPLVRAWALPLTLHATPQVLPLGVESPGSASKLLCPWAIAGFFLYFWALGGRRG